MLQTNYIVRTIKVDHPRKMIHQLRQIRRAGKAAPERLRPSHIFKEGEYVRVTTGPFYGTEGYVKRVNGVASIVLNLDILGQAVEVSIDAQDLETCSPK